MSSSSAKTIRLDKRKLLGIIASITILGAILAPVGVASADVSAKAKVVPQELELEEDDDDNKLVFLAALRIGDSQMVLLNKVVLEIDVDSDLSVDATVELNPQTGEITSETGNLNIFLETKARGFLNFDDSYAKAPFFGLYLATLDPNVIGVGTHTAKATFMDTLTSISDTATFEIVAEDEDDDNNDDD